MLSQLSPQSGPQPATDLGDAAQLRRNLQQADSRLRNVDVKVEDGGIRLTGSVGSYYAKQLAQELALPATKGQRLRNDIVVATH